MTDETRPTDGRTPSDLSEPQGRPEFLPANDGWESARTEQLGWNASEQRPQPYGSGWGDPSGRPSGDTAVHSGPDYGPPSAPPPPPPGAAVGMGPGWGPPLRPPKGRRATVAGGRTRACSSRWAW
ncbi:hypothetical protein [Nonomuraea recticatena]|uniref:hypothetical protein n=1 Tax=Nonomuraea recticatena TaxID=46178 RepID=UPI003622C119